MTMRSTSGQRSMKSRISCACAGVNRTCHANGLGEAMSLKPRRSTALNPGDRRAAGARGSVMETQISSCYG